MNEKGKNKREWVKTAAIIFLSVMLVLTFFSNTFMNYSLPEVATKYVESGTITAKIRGSGRVESKDPYAILAKDSGKVTSVAVRAGDTVQKGDVLLYLDAADNGAVKAAKEKLKEAQTTLKTAQDAYDKLLLNAEYTASDIQLAKGNFSVESYRNQINAAQQAQAQAEAEVEQYALQIKQIEEVIAAHETQITYEQTQMSLLGSETALEAAVTAAESDVTDKQQNYDNNNSDDNAAALAAAKQRLEAAKASLDAYRKHDLTVRNLTGAISNYKLQKYGIEQNSVAAQKVKEQKDAELKEITDTIGRVTTLKGSLTAISDARKEVSKYEEELQEAEEKTAGSTVNADIAGTVSSVSVTAGMTFQAKDELVLLQPEGQGCTMSFEVTNEQAKRLSVGDRADLVNAWRYDDVEVTLASIKPSKSNPGQNKELTFNITGNIVAGQTLNVSVGQKSANYDLIVPNSAIREDANGKFILIVESKSSPLGNRYVASRVDIEVIASDDTRSAVRGALYGYEYVITTSTKPVEAGKLVRLADN